MDMVKMHQPPYEKINPNGHVPAIVDPNVSPALTLWESGAIIEYLIDTYDKEHKLSYSTFPEKYLLKQYLHFQMSGQGPYFGQAAWFAYFHPEPVDSAHNRYKEQLLRFLGVLNNILDGKKWLVGDKCTYADLAFVTWDAMIPFIFKGDGAITSIELRKKFPNWFQWHNRCLSREKVRKVLEEKRRIVKQQKP
jgi:glutathione S-transferase